MTKNRIIEVSFQAAAGVLALAAVYFWSQENTDGVYLAAVAGCVCFFIGIRFQVKESIRKREIEEQQELLDSGDYFRPAGEEFESRRREEEVGRRK